MFPQYTNKSFGETLEALDTSVFGLSEKEVLARQKKYGFNEIKNQKRSAWAILKRQIRSPFFYLLFFVSLVSLAIGEVFDFGVILFIVLANLVIGFLYEHRAEKAVFFLQKIISQKAKVLRNNKEQLIDKKNLVVGDIVLLEVGDKVPADLRVIKVRNFLSDESIISGETLPVAKTPDSLEAEKTEVFEARNIIFAGASVVSGIAEGVVISIGKETFFGQIAETLLKEEYKPSSYEKDIFYFSKLVFKIVTITIVIIFILGLFIKGYEHFFNFLLFAIALIVSILPEGLPAVVSFALAKGSTQMAKRNVVVKRLSAIERLGNIDVLCTDKTGTLTKNKLSLEKIISSDKRKCLLFGLLGSNANEREKVILNPFDSALFERASVDFLKDYKKYSIVSEFPFDAERMRASFIVKNKKGDCYLIVMGAPEIVLDLCSKISDKTSKKELAEDFEKEGHIGRRVLGVGFKKISNGLINGKDHEIINRNEKGLTFLGYFVFEDPLKETSEEAIKLAKKLGLKIKVITGDSKEVAYYLSKKIRLVSDYKEVVSGKNLEALPPEEFDQTCEDADVFARISPQLKYRIVKSLQKHHDVGFLGDGVNDAPALKIADVGIAVEGSADTSREVSDIVLLKRDLRVIVEGIEFGRNIFANINKYIKCMIASNFGNFYSIAVISLFIDFLPMLPLQILLSNLLSDLPLVSIVTDKVDAEELKKPKAYHFRSVLPLVMNLAIIITLFDFIFFSVFYKEPPSMIQTLWFIESVFCELLLVFIIRTKNLFWKSEKPSFALAFSIISVFIISIALPFFNFTRKIFHFTVPGVRQLLLMSLILLCFVVVSEIVKLIYFNYWRRPKNIVS